MKLYEYLFNLYNSNEDYKEYYKLDNFMQSWIENNMASESMHESFIYGDFAGCYFISFEINHKNRLIEFFIEDGE